MRVLAGEIGCFGSVLACHGTGKLALRIAVVQAAALLRVHRIPAVG
jgi:hypothetical protein